MSEQITNKTFRVDIPEDLRNPFTLQLIRGKMNAMGYEECFQTEGASKSFTAYDDKTYAVFRKPARHFNRFTYGRYPIITISKFFKLPEVAQLNPDTIGSTGDGWAV